MRAELQWIAGALRRAGCRAVDPGDGWIEGVSTDTRTPCGGKLFVAIAGANADGHAFLADAVGGGAKALLVSAGRREEAERIAGGRAIVFAVPDTVAGLQAIAAAYRDRVNPRVIAVTGSTGKTGTKDFLVGVLSGRFRVHATPGNLNNHIGLPLTLLGMEGSEEILVIEMGANHRHEIRTLAGVARPEIGIITNIGPSHLEHFGSLKGVAAAKAELLESLPEVGTAVLPADDEFIEYLRSKTAARVLTFGYAASADRRITGVERRDGPGYRFRVGDIDLEVMRYGKHHLPNAAAAAVVGSILGVPADEIGAGIAGSLAAEGRGMRYDVGGILFVDDSYNASPASLKAAVDAFLEMPVAGKRWLVLGDMLELGDQSEELHRESGIMIGRSGVDGLLTIGAATVELARSAAEQRKAPPTVSHFLEAEKLASYLNGFLAPGDGVLVKGSHAMRMDTVIGVIERLRGAARRRID